MSTVFPWAPSAPDLVHAHRLCAPHTTTGPNTTPLSVDLLAAMVNVAFWVGLTPFEGRRLSPVLRWWPTPDPGITVASPCILTKPIPLSDLDAVRRLAAAWGSPRKMLVSANPDPVITGLAFQAGLWAAPVPSVLVESPREGMVLVSTYGQALAAFTASGFVPLASALSLTDLLNQLTGIPPDVGRALHVIARAIREEHLGATIVVTTANVTSMQVTGGHVPTSAWATINDFETKIRQVTTLRAVAGAASYNPATPSGQQFGQSLELLAGAKRQVAIAIGLLSGTDGALLFDHNLSLLGFGVRLAGNLPNSYLEARVPAITTTRTVTLGVSGTRFPSALAYVNSNPGAFALVLSHDGPVSLIVDQPAQGSQPRQPLVIRGVESLLPTIE